MISLLQRQSWTSSRRFVLLLALVMVGCSSQSTEDLQVSFSDEIEVQGKTWKKAELSARNRKDLDHYFRQHTELREHPTLNGDLVLYVDVQGTRRFYWVLPARGGHMWMLLEQDNRSRFKGTQEGTGEPFR